MKNLSVVALTSLAAMAAAQSSSMPPSPEASCAATCEETDTSCMADCYGVPSPSDDMAIDTTDCVAECPQGTGSFEDTQAYASCADQCISSYFMTATGGAPAPSETGASPTSGESEPTESADETGTETGGSTGTATGSGTTAPSATGSDGAAPHVTASGASLLGLMLAAFAL